ncbi:hypothetical protein OF83DRAFT_319071 [Amylostereum chailletii]|nr:hypothetical protein OF83DRAFT_319071 [Amylostereum chailletii]
MPSAFVPVLLGGMILTGACNSLWSKFQDMQCVENCDDPNPAHHVLYEQPFWQTLQMFLGEMLCFLPVLYSYVSSRVRGRAGVQLPGDNEAAAEEDEGEAESPGKARPLRLTGARILLMWLPAVCDLTGTTLMNIGLLYTPVSIYQMTRGALVLFVGIFSVLFLRRHLFLYQWLSLLTVMLGVGLVGFSGSLIKDSLHEATLVLGLGQRADQPVESPEATKVLVGIFFILFAQIFTATQFVVEEKILSRYTVAPLLAVGYEGLFGVLSILLLLPLLPLIHLPPSSPAAAWIDLPRGLTQLTHNPTVLWSGVLVAISISLFNYFGLSVTKYVSATARSLTDTCRTLAIWVVSLLIGWEMLLWPVSLLQVAGFALLVYGTFLFNGLVNPPKFLRPATDRVPANLAVVDDGADAENAPLLDETARLPADMGSGGFDVVPPRRQADN